MIKFLIALMILIMPLTASAQVQNIFIDGDHGKLSAILQTPAQKNYPLVIICHGFTAYKEHPLLEALANDRRGALRPFVLISTGTAQAAAIFKI